MDVYSSAARRCQSTPDSLSVRNASSPASNALILSDGKSASGFAGQRDTLTVDPVRDDDRDDVPSLTVFHAFFQIFTVRTPDGESVS